MQFDSAVNAAFPDIIRSFAIPIADIQWIVIAYTLTYAALMLVFGRVGDIFGHRTIFLSGAVVSTVAFVLCGISTQYGWLLAARVLQGIGAAGLLSCGPALITNLYGEERRTQVLSLYTLLIGIGGALGPVIGGLVTQRWGWPAVYLFRAPIALIALAAGFALPAGARRTTREDFDGLGALLLVLAIAALLLALNQLQARGNWTASTALFVATTLLGAAFAWRELRIAHPIIDVGYFRNADFALLNGGQMLLSLAGFTIFLLAPFYLDTIGHLSAPALGLVLAAAPFGTILAAPLASRLSALIHPRRLALAGAVSSATGLLTISLLGEQLNLAILAVACTMQGFGTGLYQIAYFDIATATLPKENRGVAGSLVLMTRTVGVVMGASILTLVFRTLSEGAGTGSSSLAASFGGTFAFAGGLSLLVVTLALLRGWGGAERRS